MDLGPFIKVKVQVRGTARARALVEQGRLYSAARSAMEQTLEEMRGIAAALTPKNTGVTAENIDYYIEGATVDTLMGTLYSPEAYFKVLEYGRAPGSRMPPSAPIARWMQDKDIFEGFLFPIRRAIARRGLPAHRIFRTTLEYGRQRYPAVFIRKFLSQSAGPDGE